MREAAEIAAGLGARQVRKLLAFAQPRRSRLSRIDYSLMRRGLAQWVRIDGETLLSLTPLGEQVAAILKEQG